MNKTAIRSVVLVAFLSTACYTMTPLTYEDVTAQRPSRVWVTQADQSVVELTGPQMFNDTLVGYIGGEFTELPTKEIAQVKVKRSAKGKTMALIAASIVSAAAIGVVISGVGQPSKINDIDCNEFPDEPECQGQGP